MTSDGISEKDWDKVQKLAENLVDANYKEDENFQKETLENIFKYLEKLEEKYGQKPSIISTKADFLFDDNDKRIELYKNAYYLAKKINDNYNKVEISDSLTDLYIEVIGSYKDAKYWFNILSKEMKENTEYLDKEKLDKYNIQIKKLK